MMSWFTLFDPAGLNRADWVAIERHLTAGYPVVMPRRRNPFAQFDPIDREEFRVANRHSLAR